MRRKLVRVYSRNADYQYIETLQRNREKRHRAGEFFIEGVRPVNQALKYGWEISAFIYSPEMELSGWARDILKTAPALRQYELSPELFCELSHKEKPSELLALVTMPADDLGRIPVHDAFLGVIFDRPASPGNLGTLIRSCDALGADGLVITGHSVDLYAQETISATTGSLFALPVVRKASYKDLLPWLALVREQYGGLQVVGTDEKGQSVISDLDLTGPTVLLAGNETWGLSKAYQDLCDVMARIPITGSASSLNVACATSIVLYEISRQRAAGR